jgi:NAD+ synthase (glutamine-hydrolysing)
LRILVLPFGEAPVAAFRVTVATGGLDEATYDGYSFIIDPNGEVIASSKPFSFTENFAYALINPEIKRKRVLVDKRMGTMYQIHKNDTKVEIVKVNDVLEDSNQTSSYQNVYEPKESLLQPILTNMKAYFKDRFDTVILGLSGGIDSTVVFYIASLLKRQGDIKNIKAIFMPTKFTHPDSYKVVKYLKLKFKGIADIQTIKIDKFVKLYEKELNLQGLAHQNIQARIRGNILMSESNKIPKSIVLACGNKTEYTLGYSTLYGDMAGGYAPIKDVPKTWIYSILVPEINEVSPIKIPNLVLNRKPTAELGANQFDEEDLGYSYEEMDKILDEAVHKVNLDLDHPLVRRMLTQEYKRRQAPFGPKLTSFSFETDRRFPISVRF